MAKDAVAEVDLVSAKDPCSPGVSRQHRGELIYVRESGSLLAPGEPSFHELDPWLEYQWIACSLRTYLLEDHDSVGLPP